MEPETETTQKPEGFVIDSRERVDWYLRKLANLEAEEVRVKQQADVMLRQIESDRKSLKARFQGQVENFVAQKLDAIIVIPNGIRVDEQRHRQAAITEEVVVVAAVRNASTQLTGEASQEEAGPVLNLIVESLLGWIPGDPYSYLTMAASSPPPDHESGYGYYPLAFETTYVLSGVPS